MGPKIVFKFDPRKAADAAALLLRLHGGEMNHMRLIKLLYVAERTSLDRFGRPIVGDRYVAMAHGPVVSNVYNLIKEEVQPPAWSVLIERSSPTSVSLRADSDHGSLSEADVQILTEIAHLYRQMDQFKLRDMTHEEFAEWEDPGRSSREIPVERILEVLGKTPEQIEQVRQAAEERTHFENLFGAA
jgi:uncharacterized phage-associated protein